MKPEWLNQEIARINERKQMKFENVEIGDLNYYRGRLTEFIHFKRELYDDICDYFEIPSFMNSYYVFNYGDGKEYALHPNEMYMNAIIIEALLELNISPKDKHIFDCTNITSGGLKEFIDRVLIRPNIKRIDNIKLNNIISNILEDIKNIAEDFGIIMGNSIDVYSDIKLMNENEDYKKLIAFNIDDSMKPKEIDDKTVAGTKLMMDIISKSEDHCLKDMIRCKEGLNFNQFREYALNIGQKPDGKGSVFPKVINTSFLRGINKPSEYYIDSNGGRIAQKIQKRNVGDSGAMARRLGLLAQDLQLHDDPDYDCHTQNYIKVHVKDKNVLEVLDKKYYRLSHITDWLPNSIDSDTDKHLIGKTIYVRSATKCATSNGKICYKCYGDLAYINHDIKIGNYGSRVISEKVTQRALSAKHILSARAENCTFSTGFNTYFRIDMNQIRLNIAHNNINNIKVILRDGDLEVDESGVVKVNNIIINTGKANLNIQPEGETELFLAETLEKVFIEKDDDVDFIEFSLNNLEDPNELLFLTVIKNNDITDTFNKLHTLLETKKGVSEGLILVSDYIENAMDILISGGINIPLIHLECIIRNMIRSNVNKMKLPDWKLPNNENYVILSSKQALSLNPSVVLSLSFQELEKQLISPSTYKKTEASSMDYLFMDSYDNVTVRD